MFTKLENQLKEATRTIVYTEGSDPRILESAAKLTKDDILRVILLGNVEEVKAAAQAGNFDVSKCVINISKLDVVWLNHLHASTHLSL